jgi:hypothetical protein
MGEIAEALRESEDSRVKYVIYNHRMFSSYPTSTVPAWTWRPYSGINAHLSHMHVSIQCDASKDSTRQWPIREEEWDEMATKKEIQDAVREVVKDELRKQRQLLAVGEDRGYDTEKVNLKTLLAK